METITFFLGAGFSKAAGYPLGQEINQKFKEFICENELDELTSVAKYLLKEYNEQYKDFNYEDFFEYLLRYDGEHKGMMKKVSTDRPIIEIPKKKIHAFEKTFKLSPEQRSDLIIQIENKLSILLYQIFKSKEKEEKREKYSNFIKLLKYLLSHDYQVNIFSLNHDLLLEHIFNENRITYSDGFDSDSKYRYIRNNDEAHVVLKTFSHNNFKNGLRLYKLHGSIDLYAIHDGSSKSLDFVKSNEPPYSLLFYGKIKNMQSCKNMGVNVMPSFLTGRDSKLWYKKKQKYFTEVFQCLEGSLENTKALIFIGYSFGDEYINDEYLTGVLKKGITHIIDKSFNSGFLQKYNTINKISRYFENVSYCDFMKLITNNNI